jgi:hypothetical protein
MRQGAFILAFCCKIKMKYVLRRKKAGLFMCTLAFDHIVHFIDRDPVSVIAEWKKHHLIAVKGGSHLQWGSWNSLLYFGLSYVEYLAIENPSAAQASDNPLIRQMLANLKKGEGFGTVCFRTNDIQSLRKRLQKNGFHPGNILHAERKREDGTILRWRMMFAETPGLMAPYPFFIQWDENDDDRLKAYRKSGVIPDSQARLHIDKVYYAVQSPEAHAKTWQKLLSGSPPFSVWDDDLKKEGVALKAGNTELIFTKGDTNLPFAVHISGLGAKKQLELFNGLYLFNIS